MKRNIDDKDYISYLPTELYRIKYRRWRARMEPIVDDIVSDIENNSLDFARAKYNLSDRDIALLSRLHYFTEEEVQRFDLAPIISTVPF